MLREDALHSIPKPAAGREAREAKEGFGKVVVVSGEEGIAIEYLGRLILCQTLCTATPPLSTHSERHAFALPIFTALLPFPPRCI